MIIRITILFYLLGLLVFYTAATFANESYTTWSYVYYMWQKTSDFLLMATIALRPKDSKIIIPVIYLAAARLLWEIAAWVMGLQATNPVMVGSLFIILIILCIFITIKDIKKWHRLKSY